MVKDRITLIELKKSASKTLWEADRMQVVAYYFLAIHNNLKVRKAIIKYRCGKTFHVKITEEDEKKLKHLMAEMKDLHVLPPRCRNKRKCHGCNMQHYCYS